MTARNHELHFNLLADFFKSYMSNDVDRDDHVMM